MDRRMQSSKRPYSLIWWDVITAHKQSNYSQPLCASWQKLVLRRIIKWHCRWYSNTTSQIRLSTLPNTKALDLPTLLTQISENTKVKGKIPLTLPGTYPTEGYFTQCAASLCKVKVARISRAPGNGRQACCGHSFECIHKQDKNQASKGPRTFSCSQHLYAFLSNMCNNNITSIWKKIDELHKVSVPQSRCNFSIRPV